jgi:hypothetical protein
MRPPKGIIKERRIALVRMVFLAPAQRRASKGVRALSGTSSGSNSTIVLVLSALIAIAAGIACIFLLHGIVGIICGVVVAVLLYLGLGMLLKPEARLGGIAASLVPNGEAAASCIQDARALVNELVGLQPAVRDAAIRNEVTELAGDIRALADYVERQPATYRRLSHFLNTYGGQCVPMLRGYLTVESGAAPDTLQSARRDAIDGFNALEGAAQGELTRAMNGKVTELTANSEAIKRLMEMDGYTSDARESGSEPNGQ